MTPPGWDTNPSQVSSQQTLVLIYLPRRDGKPSWLRRERKWHKSVQTLAEGRGSNWEPCGRKAEILPTAPTTPRDKQVWQNLSQNDSLRFYFLKKEIKMAHLSLVCQITCLKPQHMQDAAVLLSRSNIINHIFYKILLLMQAFEPHQNGHS